MAADKPFIKSDKYRSDCYSSRVIRGRIIIGLSLFFLTQIPISSLSQWYQDALAKKGQKIVGAVIHSPGQILDFFLKQIGPLLDYSTKPLILFFIKWGLIVGIFWWCTTHIQIPERLSKFLNDLQKIIFESSSKRFQIGLVTVSLFLTCLIAYTVNNFQPDNPDSAAQLFQARIFSSGNLYLPMPEEAEFFQFPFVFPKGTKWFTLYNPGHPFMLMLGLWAGVPWLVNPLLGAGSLFLLLKIGRGIFDEKTARLGALMFMLSPIYLFMSAGYMNNATSLFFTLLFIYFFIRTLESDKLSIPFASGFFLGAVANVRSLTALIIGFFFGLYVLLINNRKKIPSFIPKCVSFAAGCAITIGGLFLYNTLTNGNPLTFNYSVYHRMLNKDVVTMGFGLAPWGVIHTPFRGLIHLWNSFYQLNQQMFSWPVASLSLIFLFFIFSREITGWDRLFLVTATGLIGIHFFFFVIRVRYFYAIMPLLALLSARGARLLPDITNNPSWNRKGAAAFTALFLIFCFFFAQAGKTLPALVHHEGREKSTLPRLAAGQNIHNAIVFTEGGYGGWGIYLYGFNHLLPKLEDNDIIYALDLKTHNHTLAKRYPNRKTYRYIPEENKIIPYDPFDFK